MKIALGGVSFVPNLNIHETYRKIHGKPSSIGKNNGKWEQSGQRQNQVFLVDNKKEETSMGSQEFGGSTEE